MFKWALKTINKMIQILIFTLGLPVCCQDKNMLEYEQWMKKLELSNHRLITFSPGNFGIQILGHIMTFKMKIKLI